MGNLAEPIFQRAFAIVPVQIGLVELDRLVVYQKTINLAHVRRLQERLASEPTPEQIFRLCMPFEHSTVAPRVGRITRDTFVFVSESNDLRFLETVIFRPEQLAGYQPLGPIGGIVGVVVGYGSNYLNVISCEGRLVLNNGFHRSYALRELGVSRVPCVIQKVTRREELSVVGGGELVRNFDLYLRSPRPPVLKDYFNAQLCRIVRLAPVARHVRVRVLIEEIDMP